MTEEVYRYLTDKMDKRCMGFVDRLVRAGTLYEIEELAKRCFNFLVEVYKEIDYREKKKQLTPDEATSLKEYADGHWRLFSNAFVSRAIEI